MNLPEGMAIVVESGGIVRFPIKLSMEDWIVEATLYKYCQMPARPLYFVTGIDGIKHYETLEEALRFFVSSVFTKNNLALAIQGIKKHGLIPIERNQPPRQVSDLTDEELRPLFDLYFKDYFAKDFPFVKED